MRAHNCIPFPCTLAQAKVAVEACGVSPSCDNKVRLIDLMVSISNLAKKLENARRHHKNPSEIDFLEENLNIDLESFDRIVQSLKASDFSS